MYVLLSRRFLLKLLLCITKQRLVFRLLLEGFQLKQSFHRFFYKNIDVSFRYIDYIVNVFCIIWTEFICTKSYVNLRRECLKIIKMLALHVLAVNFHDKIFSNCRGQGG